MTRRLEELKSSESDIKIVDEMYEGLGMVETMGALLP